MRHGGGTSFSEVLCVFGWSEEAATAFRKAFREWERAGRPSVPLGSTNYRETFKKQQRKKKCLSSIKK
jgi:hypothetical protein